MPTSGKKSARNQGDIWDVPKETTMTVRLTKEGKDKFAQLAKEFGISTGELIERIARGIISIPESVVKDREISDREWLQHQHEINPDLLTQIYMNSVESRLSYDNLIDTMYVVAKKLRLFKQTYVNTLGMANGASRTIGSIILDAGIQWLHHETQISIERLNQLVLGELPNELELGALASHIDDLTLDELVAIVERDFSKDSGTSTNHIL